jgi:hypothetical protein
MARAIFTAATQPCGGRVRPPGSHDPLVNARGIAAAGRPFARRRPGFEGCRDDEVPCRSWRTRSPDRGVLLLGTNDLDPDRHGIDSRARGLSYISVQPLPGAGCIGSLPPWPRLNPQARPLGRTPQKSKTEQAAIRRGPVHVRAPATQPRAGCWPSEAKQHSVLRCAAAGVVRVRLYQKNWSSGSVRRKDLAVDHVGRVHEQQAVHVADFDRAEEADHARSSRSERMARP